jgi:hypothetical protein
MPDVKRLIAEVAARNGIRIDPDDPAFCLVTLNQLVLEEAGQQVAQEIRAATKDFQTSFTRLEARVGVILARALKEALASIRSQVELQKSAGATGINARSRKRADIRKRMTHVSIGFIGGSIIFGLGVLVGIAVH